MLVRTVIWRMIVAPRDDAGPARPPGCAPGRERHAPAVARGHQDAADGVGVAARLGFEAHRHVEVPLALEHAC